MKDARFERKYPNRRIQVSEIGWIERLLDKPLDDFRKYCITFILVSYLISVKRASYSETFDIIKSWLDECASIRRLDFNGKWRIKYYIKRVRNFKPISLHKLKNEHNLRDIYTAAKGGDNILSDGNIFPYNLEHDSHHTLNGMLLLQCLFCKTFHFKHQYILHIYCDYIKRTKRL
ncbi:MAG TPA: hypothetical protein VEL11_11200 [Candidatus Bathyarchaeia archaeon]|nr:hypothetical protein [Candidatus Bathyarchaeia archaeon]